jgi:alcohol dehydrogenase class IV
MHFELATATRIVFGPGTRSEVAPAAAALGTRALLLCGDPGRAAPLEASLVAHGLTVTRVEVRSEPTTDLARAALATARGAGADVVVALGGGSVIDTAKAVAALLTNGGELLDYLEVIGRGQALTRPAAPCIAVPTTAGTGAEVTRNAVLAVPAEQVKVSLRSPHLLPRLAVVDPELTLTLPPAVTASTGLDALTQVIEPYVCSAPNPITDALAAEGIRRAARSLRRVHAQGDDLAAREDLCVTSLCGGLALANARLGAVHGLAGPLGGRLGAPHGLLCAALLPHVLALNVRALDARAPGAAVRPRFDEVARWLTGSSTAVASDGADWLAALGEDLHVPRLRRLGLGEAQVTDVAEQAARASSMKGNPIRLTVEELAEVLRRAS